MRALVWLTVAVWITLAALWIHDYFSSGEHSNGDEAAGGMAFDRWNLGRNK